MDTLQKNSRSLHRQNVTNLLFEQSFTTIQHVSHPKPNFLLHILSVAFLSIGITLGIFIYSTWYLPQTIDQYVQATYFDYYRISQQISKVNPNLYPISHEQIIKENVLGDSTTVWANSESMFSKYDELKLNLSQLQELLYGLEKNESVSNKYNPLGYDLNAFISEVTEFTEQYIEAVELMSEVDALVDQISKALTSSDILNIDKTSKLKKALEQYSDLMDKAKNEFDALKNRNVQDTDLSNVITSVLDLAYQKLTLVENIYSALDAFVNQIEKGGTINIESAFINLDNKINDLGKIEFSELESKIQQDMHIFNAKLLKNFAVVQSKNAKMEYLYTEIKKLINTDEKV